MKRLNSAGRMTAFGTDISYVFLLPRAE